MGDHARRAPVAGQHDFRGGRAARRQFGREPDAPTVRRQARLDTGGAGGGGEPALAAAILENRRRVVIEADPDGPGRDAALKLDAALGGRAEISYNRGGDPADVWTDTLGERAAIMEFDGGLPRPRSRTAGVGARNRKAVNA